LHGRTSASYTVKVSDTERKERNPERGRILKAVFLDEQQNPIGQASQQLPEDDFRSLYGADIQEPPFPLEQLVFLSEQHPVHNAALEQYAADVVGAGWTWKNQDENENTDEREALDAWFDNLIDERRDETMHEILVSTITDQATVGHGAIEIARDPNGKVRFVYPMPAHTVRFGREGVRVVQIRQGKRVWFKRWMPNDERVVGAHNGVIYENAKAAGNVKIGNEVLVVKRPARRSTWYGIPTYIAALGWVTLSVLARDDNIYYFDNRREPRWAIILSNLDDDPDLEEDIKTSFRVDLKQPHRNIVIPIEGPGDIKFQQLTELTKSDMSFEKLQNRAQEYILAAHRMPPERLGISRVGPLGGSVTVDSSRIYKEAVVQPGQAMLSARIRRFIKHESGQKTITWGWTPDALDLSEETSDMENATAGFQGGILKLNEARRKIGEEELADDDPRGEMFISELGHDVEEGELGDPEETPDTGTHPTVEQDSLGGELDDAAGN